MNPENILKYTNGRGHLIMSVLLLIVGLALVLFSGDATTKGIGITLILTVQGAWFIPGAAKQVAYEVSNQLSTPLTAITSAIASSVITPTPTAVIDPDATEPKLPIVKPPTA